jgi:C4-dicarboxylate-specific signal transduction histidine kinase
MQDSVLMSNTKAERISTAGIIPRKPLLLVLWSCVRPYSTASIFVGFSFILTLALQRFFPYPFLFFFFGAVVASAWFGGTGPGLFSVVVSTLLIDYFFVPPFNSFSVSPTSEAYFAAFVACAVLAGWISSTKKKTEQALRDARDQLERRVSERTAALMKTQGELAHLSRMLSMAELTASIVHELGQPLTGVVANNQACLEWLSADPPNLEKARHSAERAVRDGTRAGKVLDRIRALFRKGVPEKEQVNVNELIQDLLVLVADEARRRHVHILTYLAQDLPKVEADRVQLQQVILNLVINAMDAMNDTPAEDKRIFLASQKNRHDQVVVRVEDCGVGLPRDACEQIFQPFFTTKPHGIGVGLSICRSIVESHSGQIRAFPRSEGGSVLEFSIPIMAGGLS